MAEKKTLQELTSWLRSHGSEPRSEYLGAQKPLIVSCSKCGVDAYYASFNGIQGQVRKGYSIQCKTCAGRPRRSQTEVAEIFAKHGATLTGTFRGTNIKVAFVCSCGNTHETYPNPIISGRCLPRCTPCTRASSNFQPGPAHPNYIDGTRSRRTFADQQWYKAVLAAADFVCDITGRRGGNMSAHHLYSYADYPDRRLDLSNGVCIQHELHELFHSKEFYGKGHHTPEQYLEFKGYIQSQF